MNLARRFTVFDGMVLIAAVAIGLLPARETWTEILSRKMVFTPASKGLLLILVSQRALYFPSLAVGGLRLLGTRPRWSRLSRQPGFVATTAIALCTFFEATLRLPLLFETHRRPQVPLFLQLIADSSMGQTVSIAIIAAWTVQALSGNWRAERTWIDRFGRVVGWAWICSYAAQVTLLLLRS